MPRAKILLDVKNITKLTSKLSNHDKGVFFSLLPFFFGEGDNYFYLNANGVKLSTENLIEHLNAENILEPNKIIERFIEKKIFALDKNLIFFPELQRQQRVSKNKVRQTTNDKRQTIKEEGSHTEPVNVCVKKEVTTINTEQQTTNNEQLTTNNEQLQEAKQDVLFHIQVQKKEQPQKSEKELKEIKIRQDAEEVLRYLNEKSGKVIGFQITKTNLTYIIGRLKEGATVEQCKMVIDRKVLQWKGRGQTYDANINPKTLFRPSADRFPTYLNEAMEYFKEKANDKAHVLKDYIQKNHPRVSQMVEQMTHDQCEKITAFANDAELIRLKLRDMENDANLFRYNGVYISLRHRIENAKKYGNKSNQPLKSGI